MRRHATTATTVAAAASLPAPANAAAAPKPCEPPTTDRPTSPAGEVVRLDRFRKK